MKTNLNIISFENKVGKNNNPFIVVETSIGGMSCFKKEHFQKIEENVGKDVSVDVEKKGDYTNLTNFYGSADGNLAEAIPMDNVKSAVETIDKFAEGRKEKTTGILVSYVKDLLAVDLIDGKLKGKALYDRAMELSDVVMGIKTRVEEYKVK